MRIQFSSISLTNEVSMFTNGHSDTQAAYQQIRSRILDGRLAPGRPVSPRNMADELMLGHTPVRSAIQRLVVEGLVEVIPRKGTYVAAPTGEDLREIFEVRRGLESTAAYLAAVNGPTPGLAQAAAQLQQLVDRNSTDFKMEQRIGWVFHQEMFEAAQNQRLLTTYKVLRVQTGLALNELHCDDAAAVRRATREHLEIYASIRAKEPEAARRHMWNHIVDDNGAHIGIEQTELEVA
jgi:DNA-binding GntR family transcriptional regulator